MLRFMLGTSSWLKRLAPGVPVVWLVLAADVALMAVRHLAKLDGAERRRALVLVRRARGLPSSLTDPERRELVTLLAVLEPRLFVGSAVRRISPVPLPKRLLYGARGSAARMAITAQRS